MMNRKGRTFKVMVHLLRKVTIDHPSGENLSKRRLATTKNAPTLCIKEELNDGMVVSHNYYHAKSSYLSVLINVKTFQMKKPSLRVMKNIG